ncbi:hypothetical protein GUJ93_ZPchr0010g7538 [Zizania palustris]|uniref:DYW domain-containing protein n=1 Tax=Zizania palustris TaxID=103762 RepID=A0A8J5SZA0_ZIZPA|nr:hypothetical protein GUJ93_ZPchr0010g7538 [Zizania palustris]
MGYIPRSRLFSVPRFEDLVKEHLLSYHSERLAIAFRLRNTSSGTGLLIIKNLRFCGDRVPGDCHDAIRGMIQGLHTDREIVVRDGKRFHCFKDVACSCGDYW